MAELTADELYKRWRDRWENFLRLVGEAGTLAEAQNTLRDKVIIGNAERKIAGGHEGREILELLQNARDAIWDGDAESGRVHVGVYDQGVLVANTGSRFDLFNPQVEDAVTMIGETGKGGEENQSIGHKGVGLKSILATGDSFEIYTRPQAESNDILGVRLSRSYLVEALLTRLGHETDSSSADEIGDAALQKILLENYQKEPMSLDKDLTETISKLPLFNFPVPLAMDEASTDPVRTRVRRLLTEQPSEKDRDPYRTAVFIRYEDSEWRSQLSKLGVPAPGEEDEDERPVEERPTRIWEYLSASESEGGLQPETIVQLGGIDELHLEKATGPRGQTVAEEQWDIKRIKSKDVTTAELSHDEVRVRISTTESSDIVHQFDRFSFTEPRKYHTTLLVNKGSAENAPSVKSYPLYLFYPIESTDGANLPFCLHGRFRVETNRKDLSANNFDTNRRVLEEGIDLIKLAAEEVGRANADSESTKYSQHLPWALLPPVPDEQVKDPSSVNDLIKWFQRELHHRLAETACIPTPVGPYQPNDTLLHWEKEVIEGYVAFRSLLAELDREAKTTDTQPLPTDATLRAVRTMSSDWTERIKTVLRTDNERATSHAVLEGWIDHLNKSFSMQEGESPAVTVSAAPARSLLEGTVTLLTAATDDDDSLDDVLGDFAAEFDGIYHLPCRVRGVNPDEQLALVTLEQRQTPSGGDVTPQRIRSVIWDIESSSRDVDRPPTPPQSANMTVYFLDEAVQAVSDVHHVMSVAGRAWGLRAYEGMPSFVRSLLDTFADGRKETVAPIDFAFLSAIVDRLGDESSDLQTGEGGFFPRDYLRTAITQQEGDQRANLRRRVQLRTCDLHLHKDEAKPIADTVMGDGWQTIREQGQQTDDDDETEVTANWEQIESDANPSLTWPEPDTQTWDVFREQINREVTNFDFARTLSLLGTGAFPGIRILWMYGDDHPSMRQSRHWDPTKWTNDDFVEAVPDTVRGLWTELKETQGYRSLLTSPDYHPQSTADHSSKCPVKTSGDLEQVNLASWIWIEDIERLTEYSATVRELLKRHGDALDRTLLRTGWSCSRGHKRRAWEKPVPSLLNWQLRELDIWDPLITVNDEVEVEWGDQASRLRYAVRMESRRGAQAARMFPHIDDDTGFSDQVLSTFGVRPVDEFGVTGATERLQKLQAILVDGPLPKEGTIRLWIPGERINDWNQAYTQLLQPVLKTLPETSDEEASDPTWGSLTHLPLRDGEQWVTASIDWITENADKIRYYQDQSPKPWETQAVEEEGYYILPRTAGGPFRRLTAALGIDQLQASKLVFDPDTDKLNIVTDQYSDDVARFQSTLTKRRDLLVASTERSDEEEIIATAEKLLTAISNLAVAESFPDDALRQLSDPSSALYATDDGSEALVLNADSTEDTLSLDGLSMGLSLLVERPTKVATFREALREDISVEKLETRWAKRTFPIESVKRVLGSNALQSLERDISALNDLLNRLDKPMTDPEPVLTALEDADSEAFTAIRKRLQTGEDPTIAHNQPSDIEIDPTVDRVISELHTALPAELGFVAEGLFSETLTHWVHELEIQNIDIETEATVIEWISDHRGVLERPPFDHQARQRYTRFRTVTELWEQTDVEELVEIETWATRLQELHSSTPPSWTERLPEEYTEQFDVRPLVVHVCIDNRVHTLLNEFREDVEAALPNVEFNWQTLIEAYVEDGTIPELETDAGAKDYQQRAFADLATALSSDNRGDAIVNGGVAPPDPTIEGTSVTVSSGGGRGGGSTQYRGRGQQAEAYVMARVIDRIATWLNEYSGSDLIQFRRLFRRLYSEQQDVDYQWHVKNVWKSELRPLLKDSSKIDRASVVNWRSSVANGTAFTELALIQLINVTMERGPGFDVIDPLGPLSTDDGRNNFGLWFTPVEVKAVGGTSPPLTFRLTTNEYRQAKAFVRNDIPYVIRLVSVPDPDTVDWPEKTEIVTEQVMETEDELDNVVGDQRFEEVVKGGYMNMRIGLW